jgi:hypothetical protein
MVRDRSIPAILSRRRVLRLAIQWGMGKPELKRFPASVTKIYT